mmetsp:Transcript_35578/g.6407  ORF Transcript_35578/g.6407 Transcript_35578/m.6407 type:complete len:94 (+) Transcript_35578:364-645(+)
MYNLRCGKGSTEIISISEVEICVYLIDINTPTSCPGYSSNASAKVPSKGYTTTYKILLGTCSLLIIYCILGIFLNKRKDPEATICESLPNRSF